MHTGTPCPVPGCVRTGPHSAWLHATSTGAVFATRPTYDPPDEDPEDEAPLPIGPLGLPVLDGGTSGGPRCVPVPGLPGVTVWSVPGAPPNRVYLLAPTTIHTVGGSRPCTCGAILHWVGDPTRAVDEAGLPHACASTWAPTTCPTCGRPIEMRTGAGVAPSMVARDLDGTPHTCRTWPDVPPYTPQTKD